MPEPGTVAQLDQARCFGGARRIGSDAEPLRGAPQQWNVADRFGCRDQQQLSGLRWQAAPACGGSPVRGGGPEGVAPAALMAPNANSAADRPRGSSRSARGLPWLSVRMRSRTPSSRAPGSDASRSSSASRRLSPRTASSGSPARAGSSSDSRTANTMATRLGPQPAGDELQRLRRGPVQPLRVVDDTDQGQLFGDHAEQREDGQAHQEPVGRRSRPQPERRPERVALRGGQVGPSDPGRGRRAGARRRRRAPSPTRPPRPGRPGSPRRGRGGTPATRSCRSRPRRAAPGSGCGPPSRRPRVRSTPRIPVLVPTSPTRIGLGPLTTTQRSSPPAPATELGLRWPRAAAQRRRADRRGGRHRAGRSVLLPAHGA